MPGLVLLKSKRMPFTLFQRLKITDLRTDKEFVTKLIGNSKGVLTVHGSGFGEKYGSGHFRLSISYQVSKF